MNNLFHIIPDAQVILRDRKGKFRQAKLYRRGSRVYPGVGNVFIRLGGGDATSCPDISYECIDLPDHIKFGKGPTGEPLIGQLEG